MELVGDMVVCYDLVGTAGSAENVRNQGKAKSAGMERKDHIMLDRSAAWGNCWLCDHGTAEGTLSRRRDG